MLKGGCRIEGWDDSRFFDEHISAYFIQVVTVLTPVATAWHLQSKGCMSSLRTSLLNAKSLLIYVHYCGGIRRRRLHKEWLQAYPM